MNHALHLLLVEDDRELRATLRAMLEAQGWRVSSAASLADARAQWRHAQGLQALDLVLLDLGLPDGDGGDWLRELRREAALPIIVLSARGDDVGKVGLLDDGADDYLVKPFSHSELLARIRVALRHRGRHVQAAVTEFAVGPIQIDLPRHQVRRHGSEVHLTPTEFKLLARLVQSAGQVVSHHQLLADVWGPAHVQHTHYLRLYMAQLRAKLEDDPADPHWLLTEAGVGYRIHTES